MSAWLSTFTPSHRGGSGPPLVLLHGFMDTWRIWELVLPALERRHDVLAPTLAGHAGGPRLPAVVDGDAVADAVERAMDEAGFETAHIAGNSLGGFVALQLAARGRARSVVALAPAGGWAPGDDSSGSCSRMQAALHEQVKAGAPHAEALVATPEGRRRATRLQTTRFEHIPAELLAHQLLGVARRTGAPALIESRRAPAGSSTPRASPARCGSCGARTTGSCRGPSAAVRYREDWLPHADWVELDGVGHCPQLDVPLERRSSSSASPPAEAVSRPGSRRAGR